MVPAGPGAQEVLGHEDLHREVDVSSRHAADHGDSIFAGTFLQERDRELPGTTEIVGQAAVRLAAFGSASR